MSAFFIGLIIYNYRMCAKTGINAYKSLCINGLSVNTLYCKWRSIVGLEIQFRGLFLVLFFIWRNTMRKFEFKKSYEEIEIAGKVYRVSLKDEDRKQSSKQLLKFSNLVLQVDSVEEKTVGVDAALKLEESFKESMLETLDVLFGEGAGNELYNAADEQTEELIPIIFEVAEIINERRQEKLNKYTKKKVK